MREVTRDEQFPDDHRGEPSGDDPREAELWSKYEELLAEYNRLKEQQEHSLLPVLESGPSETDLVIVALLMRLYDVNLALLSHFDEERADDIYEHHERGGHYNPPIFIPNMGEDNNGDPVV